MGVLDGKVALVTGAGRGIGRACALALAAEGARIAVAYGHDSDAADEVASAIAVAGGEAFVLACDVSDLEAAERTVGAVTERWGQLDILVNNAGITRDNLLLGMTDAEWGDVVGVNLSGTARMMKAVLRPMMRKRGGVIINMSSVAARSPGRGQTNYAATKGGVEAMTRALAVEMGRKGIRVVAVAPGVIETDMSKTVRDHAGAEIKKEIPLRRFGTVDDVAAVVTFLASPGASYITGAVIPVDGGFRV